MITDILITFKPGSASALITHADDQGVATTEWVNGGKETATGCVIPDVVGSEPLVFTVSLKGIARWKERLAAGDEKAHHTIIGVAKLGDVEFNGFPDREGLRIGLSPRTPTDAVAPSWMA